MSAPAPRSTRLLRSPALLRGGQWWLAGRAGAILATDPRFSDALDCFSSAAAAADLAVAELRSRQSGSPVSEDGGRR